MFDIITFGSATRDLFVKSKSFKTLKSKNFITGRGLCFDLGSKVYLDELFLQPVAEEQMPLLFSLNKVLKLLT